MTTATAETSLATRGEPKPQQAMATRKFEPMAPIGSTGALKSLLETQRQSIASMLPKHITPERIFKTMLVAVNRNPQILQCTQASVLETINRAAELGLDLSGTLGEAYPVPFNNSVKDERGNWTKLKQCSLIIGYRGLEKLAWQSGEVESIDAECVFTKDTFVFRKGTEVVVEWSPSLEADRGELIGAYACVKIKGGGKLARFLPVSELEKIRNASQSKDSPAWKNWKEEMYRKCALKRVMKDAPLSTEKFVKAMEIDAEDSNLADVVIAETGARHDTESLVNKLKGRNPREELERLNTAPDPSSAPDASPSSDAPGAGESLDTTTGEVQQASEEDHAQPAPPIDTASEVSPKEQFDIHMKELMEAGGYDPRFFTNSLKKFLLSKGKVGKGHELTGQERAELETNIKGKLFGFSTEV